MSPAFIKDLAVGHGFEKLVLEWAKIKYPNATRIEGSFKPYDIDASPSYLECKFDYKSRNTQNIVIEWECWGKPSGIQSTKATHWIHGFWSDDWIVATIKIEDLKVLIKDVPLVPGGDDMQAVMYKIPKDLILKSETATIIPLSRISVGCTLGS